VIRLPPDLSDRVLDLPPWLRHWHSEADPTAVARLATARVFCGRRYFTSSGLASEQGRHNNAGGDGDGPSGFTPELRPQAPDAAMTMAAVIGLGGNLGVASLKNFRDQSHPRLFA